MALALPLCLGGCTTTIFPPRHIEQPAQIGVLDHGRHTSLIMEVADGGMVRYSYGDWNWYALRQTGAVEATSAVVGPTKSALGRRRLPGPFSPSAVKREVRVGIENAVYLEVEARKVQSLVDRLDAIFAARAAEQIYNAAYDLEFVPHPDPYSISRNSNRVVGEWLEELGCRLDGDALFSSWKRGDEAPAS